MSRLSQPTARLLVRARVTPVATRPLTAFLGDRVETLAVTCSAMVPF